jgi:hypothetical protein
VFSSQELSSIKAMAAALKQKCAFIDVQAHELIGIKNYQGTLLTRWTKSPLSVLRITPARSLLSSRYAGCRSSVLD